MIKRENSFFEEHIEKIVLVAAGVACILLTMMFVIFSPTKVKYGGEEFSPAEIDKYIFDKQAKELEYRLNEEPTQVGPYQSQVDNFNRLIALAIDIRTDIYPPVPPNMKAIGVQPKYDPPQISSATDVSADVISTVAYVPKGTISEENLYSRLTSEPNDLDLVTVEASFDVKGLYESFKRHFEGSEVRQEWRDKSLAEPIAAAVELQRKEQFEDGSWSEWESVPRSKIEARREMLEIIEDVHDLPPGGIKVRLLDFKDKAVQTNLLQPEFYRISSPDEQWFPPSLHKKYEKYQKELRRLKQSESRTNEPVRRTTGSRRGETDKTFEEMMKRGYGVGVTDQATSAKIKDVSESINELYDEFNKLLITEDTDLSAMEEPLLIWAFDDTVEQKKKYRYRIRAGFFNPIAGSQKFANEDDPKKNDVILWSNFSEVKDVIEIPGRLYFFARDIQKAEKSVTVTICRRTLGYWYTKDFMVKPGEVIGKTVQLEKTAAKEENKYPNLAAAMMPAFPGGQLGTTVVTPEAVDYTTGAVLIDTVDTNDWAGRANLYPRYYTVMLYSYDGSKIYRLPVKQNYWPAEMRVLFGEIRNSEKEPKQPLKPWTDIKRTQIRRAAPTPATEGFDQEAYFRMLMEQQQLFQEQQAQPNRRR